MAILRYRLYDIDRIISRTLSYPVVTGLLAGVYAGLVLLATQVLSVKSPVAVAAARLATAALSNAVRRRVQRIVDRRFNRARYGAEQAIEAFAARLQDAVDPDAVQADLASVVRRALDPAICPYGRTTAANTRAIFPGNNTRRKIAAHHQMRDLAPQLNTNEHRESC